MYRSRRRKISIDQNATSVKHNRTNIIYTNYTTGPITIQPDAHAKTVPNQGETMFVLKNSFCLSKFSTYMDTYILAENNVPVQKQ